MNLIEKMAKEWAHNNARIFGEKKKLQTGNYYLEMISEMAHEAGFRAAREMASENILMVNLEIELFKGSSEWIAAGFEIRNAADVTIKNIKSLGEEEAKE